MQKNASKINDRDYRALRANLIHRGFSLRSFALAFHYAPPTVYAAARRQRAGKQTMKIRKHLEEIAYA
jgi:hypothetical protein